MIAIRNQQANNVRQPETSIQLEETMPNAAQVLKSGELSRQVVSALGVTWVKRQVVATSDKVFFSKVDSTDVLDHIPLHEIKDALDPSFTSKPDTSVGQSGFSRAKSNFSRTKSGTSSSKMVKSSPTNAPGGIILCLAIMTTTLQSATL